MGSGPGVFSADLSQGRAVRPGVPADAAHPLAGRIVDDAVEKGVVELGLIPNAADLGHAEVRPLFEERFHAVGVREVWGEAPGDAVGIEDLASWPLIEDGPSC